MPSEYSVTSRFTRHGLAVALVLLTAGGVGGGSASAMAAASAANEGALSVSSNPVGAAVYLDGRFIGETPLTLPALPAGDHRVRIVKDGYLENSRLVKVVAGKAETLRVSLTSRGSLQGAAQGLKIVVVEGEDAVNIIQQKTAVRPVVEVRDRNDLPVAGVPVVFTIGGGGGSFAGGATTLTVTTNAAGRAAVSSLTPSGNGAFQITAQASYQGQTATATISQTNFATAAEAAQAGRTAGQSAGNTAAQAGGGVGGASGGGLSTIAIAGIAGGAAVGGFAAYKVATSKDPCTFSVTPTGLNSPAGAAVGTITVDATPDDCEPNDWTAAVSNGAFLSVTPPNGNGDGTVSVNATANTGAARTGTVVVAGTTVTISQAAVVCTFTVTPTGLTSGSGASVGTITIAAAPAGCAGTWTASSNSAFLTVTPGSGTGSGTVTVNATANTATTQRVGTVTVAGVTITITQAGAAPPCGTVNVQGGDTPETRTIELSRTSGRFNFSYDTQFQEDRLEVLYQGAVIFDSGCVGTAGTRTTTITYGPGTSTQVQVRVTPNCRIPATGTVWTFTVSCPL